MFQWRRFQFFEKRKEAEEIPQGAATADGGPALSPQTFQSVDETCADSGRGYIVLGDTQGWIHIIRKGFKWSSFRAFERRTTFLQQLKTRDLLVAIGDEKDCNSVIKIWKVDMSVWVEDADDDDGGAGEGDASNDAALAEFKAARVRLGDTSHVTPGRAQPRIVVQPASCLLVERIFPRPPEVAVTAMCASENLEYIAAGLGNGAVVLFRSEDGGGGGMCPERFVRTKLLPSQSSAALTAVGFKHVAGCPSVLFAVTTNAVTAHVLAQSGDRPEVLASEGGGAFGCCTSAHDGSMVVARPEAVFFYDYDGQTCCNGPCFAFEGVKKAVMSFGTSYLLVVGVDPHQPNVDSCSIYDLENKFVALHTSFASGVKRVICEWGSIIVISGDRRVYRLVEKGTPEKLEMLFRKNLYEVAAELATATGFDQLAVADIYRRYGDHQYDKGDYDGAMTQYLRTISKGVEPSYVIRRFLDAGGAGRIDNLTRYLQRLHEMNIATADHTTLLLNCYTQLEQIDKLREFIRRDGLRYDVETAINVCRQAGFFEQGLYLADKHGQHHAWLRIQLESAKDKDYGAALQYIQRLPFNNAKAEMLRYGRKLVAKLGRAPTDVAVELCTGYRARGADGGTLASKKASAPDPAPEEYMDIFLDQNAWLTYFLEAVVERGPKPSRNTLSKVNDTLLELYLQQASAVEEEADMASRQFRNSFSLGQDSLEQVGSDAASTTEGTTSAGDEKDLDATCRSSPSELRKRAMDLLVDRGSMVDLDNALVLCEQHNYSEGLLYLFEVQGMTEHIIHHHCENGDYAQLLKAVTKFCSGRGRDVSHDATWTHVLRFLAEGGERCATEMRTLLDSIERESLLPPITVARILAESPLSTLSVCSDYFMAHLKEASRTVEEDERTVANYREDTRVAKLEIQSVMHERGIATDPGVTPSRGGAEFEAPQKHFLTLHAKHLSTLGLRPDGSPGANSGANNNSSPVGARGSADDSVHESFYRQLQAATGGGSSGDGFSLIAEHFSHNLFAVHDEDDLGEEASPHLTAATLERASATHSGTTDDYSGGNYGDYGR